MRANSPTDNDFAVLNALDEEEPIDKVTDEQKQLVKASKSKDGKVLLDYMQRQVDIQLEILKHGDFTKMTPTMATARLMATQQTLQIFEDVLSAVDTSKKAIEDASKQSKTES